MNINTARFHPRRALPPRLPRGSVAGRFGASVVPRRSVLFIFSENKYCQISSEAGLVPSGSPAALLPEDSARLSCPGGLFLSISSENKYCLIPPEAGLAPSGSPAALSPLDSAHPSCPGDRFLSIFSENKYCLIPPEAGLAPLGSPAALLPGDSAQPKGFQRPLSFLFLCFA